MSSTTLVNKELGPDGIRRYRTRAKVLVSSHNSESIIDLSNSVINLGSSKTLKSVGSLSMALVGDKNWLNVVFPNDHINVYIDRADGQGWTRLFYGFVDHIEESRQVDSSGMPTTMYSISCSDFQKAFEKTQIYFNPHVAARADFNGGFIGTPNIGGLGLMTRGVRINGSPADLVTNVILLLLGFGTQFILPTSLNPRLASRIRADRANFILNRLSEDARRQILDAGGYANWLENFRTERGFTSEVSLLTDPDATTASEVQRAEMARFSEAAVTVLGGPGSGVDTESSRGSRERGIEAYNILNTTLTGYPPSLLDVLDIFTFIERKAIDGYSIGTPIWERQDNVLGFINLVSHEVVNELFFDLRPVSIDGGLTAGAEFSRDLDEIEGNRGTDSVANGIQYVPAVIMREYPFATIDRLDASDISLTLRTSGGGTSPATESATTSSTEASTTATASPSTTAIERQVLGVIHFGAIFSNEPNVPGRHVITIPNMNPDDQVSGSPDTVGYKHLDVATVYDSEIVATKFTRSDSDHFNVFEFYSDAMLGNDARFFMQDLLPIITPVHIIRHGLRVRSLTTRFGRFGLDVVSRTTSTASPRREEEEATSSPEPGPATPRLPVDLEVSSSDPTVFVRGNVSDGNDWGYRFRRYRSETTRIQFNGVTYEVPGGTAIWRFHNGIDVVGGIGTPVYAVRDGWVVAAAPANPDGTGRASFTGYGGTVIIYHDLDSPESPDGTTADGAIFTLYAHLSSIDPSCSPPNTPDRRAVTFVARELRSDGRFTKVRVRAGQKIGEIGNTGSVDNGMGPHLHFEVIRKLRGQVHPSRNRRLTPDYLTNENQLVSNGGWAPSGTVWTSSTSPSGPDAAESRSLDPISFCREQWGLNFTVGRRVTEEFSSTADPETAPDASLVTTAPPQVYTGDAGELNEEELPETISPTITEEETTERTVERSGHVDTPSTRRQIARWALLHDHWYQHNLEYLSGTVEMRGAPEIRVGYRLDLIDRNLSFYVEGVSHNWSYGRPMTTTLHVTRGQPNNPYPSYVLPYVNGFDPTNTQRRTGSRLASYFVVPDPLSVRRAIRIEPRQSSDGSGVVMSPVNSRGSGLINEVDMPLESGSLKDRYNEQILPAVTVDVPIDVELALQNSKLGLRGENPSTASVETNPMSSIVDIEDLLNLETIL